MLGAETNAVAQQAVPLKVRPSVLALWDFEAAFGRWFTIEQVTPVRDAERVMYLMRRRES